MSVTPDVWDSDLKLQLLADDQASEVLTTLADTVASLITDIESINDIGNVFEELTTGAQGLADEIDNINTAYESLKTKLSTPLSNPFSAIATDAQSAVTSVDDLSTAIDGVKSSISGFGSLNPFTSLDTYASSASTAIDGVSEALATLKSDIASFKPASPFTGLDQDSVTLTADIDGVYKAWGDMSKSIEDFKPENPFSSLDTSTTTFAGDIKSATSEFSTLKSDLSKPITTNPFSSLDTYLNNVVSKLEHAISLRDNLSGHGTSVNMGGFGGTSESLPSVGSMGVDELNAMFETLDSRLEDVNGTMQELSNRIAESLKNNGSGGSGSTKNNKGGLGFTSSDLMNVGMTGMMAYYGLQSVVNGAANFQNVQNMATQGMGIRGKFGSDVTNQSAQNLLMLQSAGLGMGDLTGVVGNLQKQFTLSGYTSSAEYKQLASLGVTKDQIQGGESPWAILQSIQKDYQNMSSDPAKQMQLLSLTGTTQFQNMFNQWSTLQKDSSGVDLGMNSTQLSKATQDDSSMLMSMQKLSLAFDQLSQAVAPFVSALGSMVTAVTNFNTHLGGFLQKPLDFVSSMGGTAGYNRQSEVSTLNAMLKEGQITKSQYHSDLGAVNGGQGQMVMSLRIVTQQIQNWSAGLWGAVSPNFGKWKTNITGWSSSLWGDVKKDFSKWKDDLGGWSSSLWDDVKSDFAKWPKDMTGWSGSLWDDVKSDFASWKQHLTSWASGLWGSTENVFAAFGDNIKLAFENLALGVEEALNKIPLLGKMLNLGGAISSTQSSINQTQADLTLAQQAAKLGVGTGTANTVNHSGTIVVQLQGGAGLSKADQTALEQLATKLVTKLKLSANVELSY